MASFPVTLYTSIALCVINESHSESFISKENSQIVCINCFKEYSSDRTVMKKEVLKFKP